MRRAEIVVFCFAVGVVLAFGAGCEDTTYNARASVSGGCEAEPCEDSGDDAACDEGECAEPVEECRVTCGADAEEISDCPDFGDCWTERACGESLLCWRAWPDEEPEMPICAAQPCEPGFTERAGRCGDEPGCVDQLICEQWFACIPSNPCAEPPACDAGDRVTDVCNEHERCYRREGCGRSLLCAGPRDCEAVCPDDYDVVESCDDVRGENDCVEVECDGSPVFCGTNFGCDVRPDCDDGDVEVGVCPDDAACYTRYQCGLEITCAMGESTDCEAFPECEPWDTRECAPGDARCYSREVCGARVECAYGCDEVPRCFEGYMPIAEPSGLPVEIIVSSCGFDLYCAPRVMSSCQASASCDEGFIRKGPPCV